MSKTTNFRSFIVGGIIGATAGLLLAPQSGEKTRGILKDESLRLKENTLQSIEQSKESRFVRRSWLTGRNKTTSTRESN